MGADAIGTIVLNLSNVQLSDVLQQDSALSAAVRRVLKQAEQPEQFEVCGFSNFI